MFSVEVDVRSTNGLPDLSSHVVQVNTTTASSSLSEAASVECKFDGVIVFSQPLTLNEDGDKYDMASFQQAGYKMTIDRINSPHRCGVVVGGKRYGLALAAYGDNSSEDMVESIAKSLASTKSTGFLLGPYSSSLTKMMSPIANEAKRLFVTAGSSQTPVFQGNEYVFGTLSPSETKLKAAIKVLTEKGAKTIAVVHEDGSQCSVPFHAEENGLELLMNENAGTTPSPEELDSYVKNLTALAPDISVACGFGSYCGNWVKSMRRNNFSPKSQLFVTCQDLVRADVGMDAAYMMAGTEWHPTMNVTDEVTGWSASDFNTTFGKRSYRAAAYQSASASAAISVVVQAIERTGTLDDDVLRDYIANAYFPTVKANLTFNNNGQAFGDSLMLQFVGGKDRSEAVIVYPPEKAAGGFSIAYPMPTWEEKDCRFKSECELTEKGNCDLVGNCICTNSTQRSIGVGYNATCSDIAEDFTHVNGAWYAVGYTLFAIQTVLSIFCMAWTLKFRKRTIVKASQPEYMALICLGAWIIVCGIIPLSLQKGDYRYLQDGKTGEETDERNEDIYKVDAACMAYPWLFAIGFALTFGALFAKIWRINKLMGGASAFRRTRVSVKDVAGLVIGLLAVEISIMLTWQLVDPLQWQRDVVIRGVNEYPVKSVGFCASVEGNGKYFLGVLGAVNLTCLLFALYLCYHVRKIPSDYQESKWITASIISMFQVGIIAVPVLYIVQENTDVFYFVSVMIPFLLSSTVTLLMFGPKVYQFHVRETATAASSTNSDGQPNVGNSKSKSSFSKSKSSFAIAINPAKSRKNILQDPTEEEKQPPSKEQRKSIQWAESVNDDEE